MLRLRKREKRMIGRGLSAERLGWLECGEAWPMRGVFRGLLKFGTAF
jgi:hypothetical protein